MAIDVKPILNAGLAAQSAALAGSNLKLIKKKKKVGTKGIVKAGVTNIAGIELIRLQGGLIGGL